MSGLVHIYTGDGKGKTTAALGLALRNAGSGNRVLILQFMPTKEMGPAKAVTQPDSKLDSRIRLTRKVFTWIPRLCA